VESFRKHEVIPLRADLSKSEAPGWKLLRQISPVGAIPLTAIYPPNGNDPHQLSGIYTTDELVQALDQAAAGSTATALLPSNR
jgi:thiol:disulfide interchange protein